MNKTKEPVPPLPVRSDAGLEQCPDCGGEIDIFVEADGARYETRSYMAECGCGLRLRGLPSNCSGRMRDAKSEWNRWARNKSAKRSNVKVTGLPQPADGSDTNNAECGRPVTAMFDGAGHKERKAVTMQVTQEMLEAAMKAAVQTGLLPKYADGDTYLKRWDAMKQCIQAAIDAAPEVTPN